MKFLISLLFLCVSISAAAQNFSIKEVNVAAFPNISFTVAAKKQIDKGQVSITDNNKPVSDFQWIPSDEKASETGAVYFLIETSSFVNNNQLAFVKSAVKAQLLTMKKTALANAGYYSRSNSVEMLKRLSTEFTNDFTTLSRDVESKIFLSNDKIPVTDLYKVVYECLDYIGKKSNLPVNRKIILISTGNNNGTSAFSINECIEKAKEKNITITTIGLRSNTQNAIDNLKLLAEKTNGNYTYAKNEGDINLFLQQENQSGKPTGLDSSFSYRVQYKSGAASTEDSVLLHVSVGQQAQEILYSPGIHTKSATGFFSKNKTVLLITGAIILFLLLGLFIFLRNKRKKETFNLQQQELKERELIRKRAEKEAEEKKNQDLLKQSLSSTQVATGTSGEEENRNKTMIAGVKRPRITVMQPGAQKFYELNNLSNKIGRNADNDISIVDKTVSGFHALITIEHGKIFITDNNSTNGTFVNNKPVQRSELHNNDIIILGKMEIRYNH